MLTMTTNVLSKLKDEYCQAPVERMTKKQMRAYLFQIFSNDIAYDSMETMEKKVCRVFSKEFFEQLMTDIATESERSSVSKVSAEAVD